MDFRFETVLVVDLLRSLVLFLFKLLSLKLETVKIKDFEMALYSGDLQMSDTKLLLFIVETNFHGIRLHYRSTLAIFISFVSSTYIQNSLRIDESLNDLDHHSQILNIDVLIFFTMQNLPKII